MDPSDVPAFKGRYQPHKMAGNTTGQLSPARSRPKRRSTAKWVGIGSRSTLQSEVAVAPADRTIKNAKKSSGSEGSTFGETPVVAAAPCLGATAAGGKEAWLDEYDRMVETINNEFELLASQQGFPLSKQQKERKNKMMRTAIRSALPSYATQSDSSGELQDRQQPMPNKQELPHGKKVLAPQLNASKPSSRLQEQQQQPQQESKVPQPPRLQHQEVQLTKHRSQSQSQSPLPPAPQLKEPPPKAESLPAEQLDSLEDFVSDAHRVGKTNVASAKREWGSNDAKFGTKERRLEIPDQLSLITTPRDEDDKEIDLNELRTKVIPVDGMAKLFNNPWLRAAMLAQVTVSLAIADLHARLEVNPWSNDTDGALFEKVHLLMHFYAADAYRDHHNEFGILLDVAYLKHLVDDGSNARENALRESDYMCYEALFPNVTFPRNLNVISDGEDAWRSNLYGLLILISLACMNVDDTDIDETYMLVPFLSAVRDDADYEDGLQKLSVLLLGMGLSPAISQNTYVKQCCVNRKTFLNSTLKKTKNKLVPADVARALQFLSIEWLYQQMLLSFYRNYELLRSKAEAIGDNTTKDDSALSDKIKRPSSESESECKPRAKQPDSDRGEILEILNFLSDDVVGMYENPLDTREKQKEFQEYHLYDIFAKFVSERSGAVDSKKKDKKDQKVTYRDLSLHADNYHYDNFTKVCGGEIMKLREEQSRLIRMVEDLKGRILVGPLSPSPTLQKEDTSSATRSPVRTDGAWTESARESATTAAGDTTGKRSDNDQALVNPQNPMDETPIKKRKGMETGRVPARKKRKANTKPKGDSAENALLVKDKDE